MPRPELDTRLILAALLAALLAVATGANAETLTILHTNDFHSRIEPINAYDSACPPEDNAAGTCFGGSARLVTAIRAARAAAPHSLLVDGGDQFQGSLFYTRYKGQAAAEMMNALGYDAMTVGNHEFDDGPEVLRGFMDTVGFPVLMSNADVSAEPALAGVLMPATVIEKGGHRYGLIGLTPEDTPDIASPGPRIRFHNPVDAVRREIARLAEDGITRIIVLSHSGHPVDQRIAAEVDGIDVIVGGHSNTYLSNNSDKAEGPYPTWVRSRDGGRTAIVQAYAYGKYLGRLDVAFDDEGRVTGASGEPILMDGKIAEDSALKDRIAALAGPLEAIRNEVIGEAATPIGADRAMCRARECAIGNLVAEAMLERVRDQGVEIAIQNGGGLRAAIDAGPITMGEVLTVLPFQNLISTFRLTGADLLAALEHGVGSVEDGRGRFPQVAGLRYTYDPAAAPGNRVSDVSVERRGVWTPLDTGAVYGVVSNDFLRRGGDGYAVLAGNAMEAYDFGPDLADVVADYLARHRPYRAATDGRIGVK